jgi:LytS/YehU family sensor histidine kinase
LQNGNGFFEIFWVTLVNALFFFGYAYITIFLLIPEFLLKEKIIRFIILFILVGIALSALKLVVSDQIYYSSISPENLSEKGLFNLRFIVVNTKDMTFIVAMFCIAKYVKDYLYTNNLRKKLEIQSKHAQSKLLQSQFDPHFLFNTINNLYALSLLDPLKTQNVIARIKTVLKYIIDETQKDFVELNEEIVFIENYIQLEKLRYGKRLKVEFLVEGQVSYMKIPPMILFVLTENCFKHGSSLDAGTPWINIKIKTEPGAIKITTKNSKPKSLLLKEENDGLGLKNLEKRLRIMYKKQGYNLEVNNSKNQFEVELELKESEFEIAREKYR